MKDNHDHHVSVDNAVATDHYCPSCGHLYYIGVREVDIIHNQSAFSRGCTIYVDREMAHACRRGRR